MPRAALHKTWLARENAKQTSLLRSGERKANSMPRENRNAPRHAGQQNTCSESTAENLAPHQDLVSALLQTRRLSVKQASFYTGLSCSTLNRLRCTSSQGPRFAKIGRRVLHDVAISTPGWRSTLKRVRPVREIMKCDNDGNNLAVVFRLKAVPLTLFRIRTLDRREASRDACS